MTTIIPVSVAIMTPLPLLGLYIALRCRQKYVFLVIFLLRLKKIRCQYLQALHILFFRLAPQRETETLVTPKGENGPPIITSNRADAS